VIRDCDRESATGGCCLDTALVTRGANHTLGEQAGGGGRGRGGGGRGGARWSEVRGARSEVKVAEEHTRR
jgi:hypothetical protein